MTGQLVLAFGAFAEAFFEAVLALEADVFLALAAGLAALLAADFFLGLFAGGLFAEFDRLELFTKLHSGVVAVHGLGAVLLAFDFDAGGFVFQVNAGGCLVDFLAAVAGAADELFDEVLVEDVEFFHAFAQFGFFGGAEHFCSYRLSVISYQLSGGRGMGEGSAGWEAGGLLKRVGNPLSLLGAALSVLDVGMDGGGDVGGDGGAGDGEGGDEPGVGADDVGEDGDFSIAGVIAAADADGGDVEGGGEVAGHGGEDAFEDDAEAAGGLESEGALVEGFDFVVGLALLFVAAFLENALGEHAEVAEDGDAGSDHGADLVGLADAAFEFDGLGAGLDEALGVVEGFGGGGVAVDGEVGDEEGAGGAPGGGGGMVEHVLHGDVGGVRVAEDDHAEGVADEDEIEAGFVEETGGGVVVGGEGRDGRAGGFPVTEGGCFLRTGHGREDHRVWRAGGRIKNSGGRDVKRGGHDALPFCKVFEMDGSGGTSLVTALLGVIVVVIVVDMMVPVLVLVLIPVMVHFFLDALEGAEDFGEEPQFLHVGVDGRAGWFLWMWAVLGAILALGVVLGEGSRGRGGVLGGVLGSAGLIGGITDAFPVFGGPFLVFAQEFLLGPGVGLLFGLLFGSCAAGGLFLFTGLLLDAVGVLSFVLLKLLHALLDLLDHFF